MKPIKVRVNALMITIMIWPSISFTSSQDPRLLLQTQSLEKDIQQASHRISIATYDTIPKELHSTNNPILQALQAANNRGVDVFIQWNGFQSNYSIRKHAQQIQNVETQWCKTHHYHCTFPSQRYAYYHDKFLIIDNHIAYIMTGKVQ